MAPRDLEKEYDPTQWTKRFDDPKELLESHKDFGNQGEYLIGYDTTEMILKIYLMYCSIGWKSLCNQLLVKFLLW